MFYKKYKFIIISLIGFFFIIFITCFFVNKSLKIKYKKTGYIVDCIDSNTFLFHFNEDNKNIEGRFSWYEVYESKLSNDAYKQAKKMKISIEEITKKGNKALKNCKKYIKNDIGSNGKKYEYDFVCYNKYDNKKRIFCDFESKDFLYVVLSIYNDEKENYTIEIDNSWIEKYKFIN